MRGDGGFYVKLQSEETTDVSSEETVHWVSIAESADTEDKFVSTIVPDNYESFYVDYENDNTYTPFLFAKA